jgi:arylformamidase
MEKSDKVNCVFLSHPLSGDTPSYANRDSVNIVPKSRIEDGETANTSTWELTNNHIGTHVDVPKHFYDNGKTLTDIKPEEWIFEPVTLIDIPCETARLIKTDDLKAANISPDAEFLIIRTGFEQQRQEDTYWNYYPGISSEACEFLRSNFPNIRGVGFDFISLTSPVNKEEGKKAHRVLLREDMGSFVFIVEDMKLSHLHTCPSKLLISPLLVEKGNGGPVTVFGLYEV